jgi:hypothetical protein
MEHKCLIALALLMYSLPVIPSVHAQERFDLSFYQEQSPTTSPGKHADLYRNLPHDPAGLVKVVQGLIMHGGLGWLYKHQPTENQFAGFTKARTAEAILDNILRLDPSPLTIARPIEKRAVGNCRTFSVLMISMLRNQGVPARMRVGYATYTWGPPKLENHFVVEYFNGQRWVLLDAQMDQVQRDFHKLDFDTLDMPRDKFILAGQAWQDLQTGAVKPEQIGIGGPKGWEPQGYQFVQIDLLADCWALDKVELFTGESNDLAKTPHDRLNAEQLKLFDALAHYSTASSIDTSALRWRLESAPTARVDPVAWNPH